jgi:hypothetical protein
MNRSSLLLLSALLLALIVTACGATPLPTAVPPTATKAPTATAVPPTLAPATATVAANATAVSGAVAGTRCLFAGAGATLSFNNKRLNFTCPQVGTDESGLIGNVLTGAREWEIEKAIYARGSDGFTMKSSAKATIAYIELADGTVCASAGGGATLAFGGKRLNYTCPSQGGDIVGLIGDVVLGAKGWEIDKALISQTSSGFTLKSSAVGQIAGLRVVDAPK